MYMDDRVVPIEYVLLLDHSFVNIIVKDALDTIRNEVNSEIVLGM